MTDSSVNRVIVRKEDVERNMSGSHNEIPYVPLLEDETERKNITVKLPDGTKISVTQVHATANKEQFLAHSIAAKRAIEDLGYLTRANACEDIIQKSTRMMKKYYQAEPVQGETEDEAKRSKYDAAKVRYEAMTERLETTIKKMLSTFKSFLHESIRPNFEEIIQKKLNISPWVNLRGEEVKTEMEYSVAAYDMCWMFFMRTVFQQDAAEQLLNYMLYHLKKPLKIPVRIWCGRVSQMNNFVEFLPGLFYSSRATTSTAIAEKLNEPALAQLVLRLAPLQWQSAYEVLRNGLPQNLEDILQFLETQERHEKSIIPAKPKDSYNKKDKKRSSPDHGDKSRKKAKKHCDLCEKNKGPANTHNTSECRRYNPDGSSKYQKGKFNNDKKTHHNFSQQLTEAQKEIKDLKKKVKRIKTKRTIEDSDSDSDA